MIVDFLVLLAGFVLLIGGGEVLVRGASAVAYRLGVSPLVVGLTVVAFGTSAPEMAVNVAAALRGSGEMSFGNIMGSNIANVGMVIGVTAALRPLVLHRAIIVREIPMMTLAALFALVMAFDTGLMESSADVLSRGDGILLLLLFCVFLYYTVGDALRQRATREDKQQAREHMMSIPRGLGFTLAGLVGLTVGGNLTVQGATGLARGLGMSEAVIGLTVVAVGTSLPELVTSIIGVVRKESALAVGNAIGSNIFNVLFVMGTTSTIRPVPVPAGGHVDLLIVILFSVGLLPLSLNPKSHIPRSGGMILVLAYVAYLTYRVMTSGTV